MIQARNCTCACISRMIIRVDHGDDDDVNDDDDGDDGDDGDDDG